MDGPLHRDAGFALAGCVSEGGRRDSEESGWRDGEAGGGDVAVVAAMEELCGAACVARGEQWGGPVGEKTSRLTIFLQLSDNSILDLQKMWYEKS
jgi:hypothetical protein